MKEILDFEGGIGLRGRNWIVREELDMEMAEDRSIIIIS